MKTNIYILIVFLLSVSFAGAQNTNETTNVKLSVTSVVSQDDTSVEKTSVTNANENEVLFIEASEVKESIAKSTSDIRKYFNKTRNVDNLSLLFPKMNKAEKA